MRGFGEGTASLTLGAFDIDVILDGKRPADKVHETFGINGERQEVLALLAENFLPEDRFVTSFAPVLVRTGSETILFDTGMGEAGASLGTGRLVEGLAALGLAPDDITTVVLTHLHPDHYGGVMTGGRPTFGKADYVIGAREYDFWTSRDREGTPAQGNADQVRAKVVPLAERARFIGDGDAVHPGITAHAAFGHSPGHMIFRLESQGKTLVLTADTCNHFVLSLQRPDWEVRYDADKAMAAKTRKSVFGMLASERIGFIGYHMPFPGIGFVEAKGEGFRFVPASYQFDF